MKASPYFFLDIIYIHEAPSQDNNVEVGIAVSSELFLKNLKRLFYICMSSFQKLTLVRKSYILYKMSKLSLLVSLYFLCTYCFHVLLFKQYCQVEYI